jgi:hypothetical protein
MKLRAHFQLLLSILVSAALVAQFIYGLTLAQNPLTYMEQFLSYFTILSNILVALIFIGESISQYMKTPLPRSFQVWRGAAVFYILITGVVYALFLRGPGGHGQVAYSIAWINSVFHYLVPTLVVADWLIFCPRTRISWVHILSWISGTALYVIFVEVGGLMSHEYPYFFLDPTLFHGYSGVLRASLAFIPFFLVFGVLVIGSANSQIFLRRKFARTRPAASHRTDPQ